jgi:hypothetical protein
VLRLLQGHAGVDSQTRVDCGYTDHFESSRADLGAPYPPRCMDLLPVFLRYAIAADNCWIDVPDLKEQTQSLALPQSYKDVVWDTSMPLNAL